MARKRTLWNPTELDRLVALGLSGTAYDPDTQDQAVVVAGFIVAYCRTPVEAEIKLSQLVSQRNRTLRNLADQASAQTERDVAWMEMARAAETALSRKGF